MQDYTRDFVHRQILRALQFGHERVGTTQVRQETTIPTKGKVLEKASRCMEDGVALGLGTDCSPS